MSSLRQLIREIHRRSLWQVLAIYIVGGWLVLQVVDVLAQNMNLPAWTFPFAMVLLLIGLPIVLATAFVQEGMGHRDAEAGPGDVETTTGGTPIPPSPAHAAGAGRLFTWRNALAGGVVAFAIWGVAAAGWFLFGGGQGRAATESGSGDVIESIAVLPFADMSATGDQEYFSDGMAEEILDALAQVPGLRVAARSSSFQFKGRNPDVREVGETLGVNTVLEGSVRKDGDQLRITAQLINADDGFHIWSESYERQLSSVFALQKEIATSIVDALSLRLPGGDGGASPTEGDAQTTDLEAYDLYLRGRALVRQRGSALRSAIPLFEEAIERDSTYSLAWAALAETYGLLPYYTPGADSVQIDRMLTQAEDAAGVALELDPDLAEAHLALGNVLRDRREWAPAEREYRLVLALRPEYAEAYQQLAELLAAVGRNEEALELARRATELDPLTAIRFNVLGYILRMNGRTEESIEQLLKARSLDPDLQFAALNLMLAYVVAGRYDEAERHVQTMPMPPAFEGDRDALLLIIRGTRDPSVRDSAMGISTVGYYPSLRVLMGDRDGALNDLEGLAFDPPFGANNWISEPQFDEIRDDPRFVAMVERWGVER